MYIHIMSQNILYINFPEIWSPFCADQCLDKIHSIPKLFTSTTCTTNGIHANKDNVFFIKKALA